MGSGWSECISVMGLMLLMQFHLVVLFFCCCSCAFLSPFLLSAVPFPPSLAILRCPLSNGIKWSTKCGRV